MTSVGIYPNFCYRGNDEVERLANKLGQTSFIFTDFENFIPSSVVKNVGSFSVDSSLIDEGVTELQLKISTSYSVDSLTGRFKLVTKSFSGADLQELSNFSFVFEITTGQVLYFPLKPVRSGYDLNTFYEFELSWTDEPLSQPECDNVPDGLAECHLIVERSTGDKVYLTQEFDFTLGGEISLDFGYAWFKGDRIVGYRFQAQHGFTSGNVQISEVWEWLGETEFNNALLSGSCGNGETDFTVLRNSWAYELKEYGFGVSWPAWFTGKIKLVTNFDSLPECLPDIVPAAPIQDFIITLPPQSPTFPEPIIIQVPPPVVINQPVYPSIPPEYPVQPSIGCECEIYIGQQIQTLTSTLNDLLKHQIQALTIFQNGLDSRLYDLIKAIEFQTAIQNYALEDIKQLLEKGLKHDEKGLAEILSENDFAPFIHVDTNACSWHRTNLPDGDMQ